MSFNLLCSLTQLLTDGDDTVLIQSTFEEQPFVGQSIKGAGINSMTDRNTTQIVGVYATGTLNISGDPKPVEIQQNDDYEKPSDLITQLWDPDNSFATITNIPVNIVDVNCRLGQFKSCSFSHSCLLSRSFFCSLSSSLSYSFSCSSSLCSYPM